jgi:ABC-type transport system substrate-binding protein
MVGLKDGEFSNGTNQQVTAKDAVFTFLTWSNPNASVDTSYHSWISDCYVDPIDPLAFHIHIDGDPTTPEIEHYVDFLVRMNFDILPEFFLNSTYSNTTYTTAGIECKGLYDGITETEQWIAFSTSAFGCGKYMLNYSIPNSVSEFVRSPYWMNIGSKYGEPQSLDIDTIRIRVIPDATAELAEFKAGNLDWTGLTIFPAEREQMETDPRFDVQSKLGNSFSFIAFNLKRPFIGGNDNKVFLTEEGKEEYTKGLAVRKAIIHAIDRVEMNEELHDGQYLICHNVIYPYTAYFYYDDLRYEYDLEKSFEWLAAAGYPTPTQTPTPTSTTSSYTTIDYSFSILALFPSILLFKFIFNRRKERKS